MIARLWYARTSPEKESECVSFVESKVFPELHAIEGYKSAKILRRDKNDGVELVVITIWESMQAVREFAGEKPEVAVVPPRAAELLLSWDSTVSHYEIASEHE